MRVQARLELGGVVEQRAREKKRRDDQKRHAAGAFHKQFHGMLRVGRRAVTLSPICGNAAAALWKSREDEGPPQGQKISLVSANSMTDKTSVKPRVMNNRIALSDGGLPLTAS